MSTYERRTKLSITKDGYQVKSQYIKYDKASQLWIQHRKVVYLYWYKFLQHAEQGDYQVDWSKYELWGGKQTVMDTKFDAWWKEHWKVCFSFTKGNAQDAPYHTKSKPEVVALRTALLIYENRYRGSKWDIGCWVRKSEISKGREPSKSLEMAIETLETKGKRMTREAILDDTGDTMSTRKTRKVVARGVEEISGELLLNKLDKKRVQGYVSRYLKQADDLMTNIAKGSLDPSA